MIQHAQGACAFVPACRETDGVIKPQPRDLALQFRCGELQTGPGDLRHPRQRPCDTTKLNRPVMRRFRIKREEQWTNQVCIKRYHRVVMVLKVKREWSERKSLR